MSIADLARFDDPDFYLGDPDGTFRSLRDSDPVHWYAEGQFWVITKYDDLRFVSSRPDLFRSSRIAILSDLVDRKLGREPQMLGQRGVLFMDPPEHGAHRRTMSGNFTPRAVQQIEGHVQTVIRQVLDALPEGEFDWVELVAEPIPVYVFSKLLGIPEDDWPRVSSWATTITNAGTGRATEADMDLILGQVGPYLLDLTMQRRAHPADDFLTMLTTAEIDGVPFDEIQVMTWALTLLAAGSETTQSLIAALAACLDRFPDQATLLFSDSSLASNTVEETLRWWTPVMSMARQSATDVDLRGKTLEEGDGMLLAYASGNRDSDRWGPTADDFDIGRPDAFNHVGFGFGEHFCMGAHLARREARILLEELVCRSKGIQVVGEPVPRYSSLVRTYDRLPVELTR